MYLPDCFLAPRYRWALPPGGRLWPSDDDDDDDDNDNDIDNDNDDNGNDYSGNDDHNDDNDDNDDTGRVDILRSLLTHFHRACNEAAA